MPRVERHRCLRITILTVILGCGLGVFAASGASAEPISEERRQVAAEVAESFCRTVPSIPRLPPTVEPRSLCVAVLVENLDPEGSNDGTRVACITALPLGVKYLARSCAQVMDRLLDPARVIFLDRVVPAVQQLTCVTSTPAAFDCLTQQVHVWLKQSILTLWRGLMSVLTADTEAVEIIEGWRHQETVSLYEDVGALGALVLLGLLITSLIISVVKFDFRHFGSTLLGVVMWGIFWASGVTIAVLLIKASDGASRWLAGGPDVGGQTDLDRAGEEFGRWVDYISGAAVATPGFAQPTYDPGSLTALLICLLLVVAIVVTLVALLMRNIALLLLIVLLPLTLAGSAGPALTRSWLNAAIRMFVALLLAKPLIVVAVRLGAALVSVPREGEPQATFSDALLGVAIILLAGLIPGVIYRFSGGLMAGQAGAPPRTSGGFSEQSAHSATSSMDMTRMIMESNVLRPMSITAAGSPSHSGVGSAGLASASLASSGVAAATSGSSGRGARGSGAAVGPLGAAVAASAILGGAVESGGRWAAGQAATGGGVLGDVEAPRVPSPPLPRMGRYGNRTGAGQVPSVSGEGGARATPGPQPVTVTVSQVQEVTPTRPQLPSGAAPLVIPGQTEPDRKSLPVPRSGAKAPSRGGDRP